MNCPNCGHEVTTEDRFCSNCGARLGTVTPPPDAPDAPPQPSTQPTQPETGSVLPTLGNRRNAWEVQRQQLRGGEVDDEWKMSDLGPPPPPKRRTWLWIVIAVLALMVLACCIFGYWVTSTESGQEWFAPYATEAAEILEATEQASGTPTASPEP